MNTEKEIKNKEEEKEGGEEEKNENAVQRNKRALNTPEAPNPKKKIKPGFKTKEIKTNKNEIKKTKGQAKKEDSNKNILVTILAEIRELKTKVEMLNTKLKAKEKDEERSKISNHLQNQNNDGSTGVGKKNSTTRMNEQNPAQGMMNWDNTREQEQVQVGARDIRYDHTRTQSPSWTEVVKRRGREFRRSRNHSENMGAKQKEQPDENRKKQEQTKPNPAYKLANRCQGIIPITEADFSKVEVDEGRDANQEEVFQMKGKKLYRIFLKEYLNMPEAEINQIRIKNVFRSKGSTRNEILYAEMEDEEDLKIIRRYVKNMHKHEEGNPKKPGLVQYIPRSIFLRHKEVQRRAWAIRNAETPKATKIWITHDFELRTRDKGDLTPWANIKPEVMDNLPEQEPRKERETGEREGEPETPKEAHKNDQFTFLN